MASDKGERRQSAGLIALLIADVEAAQFRLSKQDDQSNRRDFVRTVLAAMEGSVWELRRHVASALSTYGQLTAVADLALREMSYSVTADGQVNEHARGMPLTTAIRLVVSQVKIVSPAIDVDFGGQGWMRLKEAVAVRNRITHPKTVDELTVSNADMISVERALKWTLALTHYVMASTNLALVRYNDLARELVLKLKDGDPDVLAEYKAALEDTFNDETL